MARCGGRGTYKRLAPQKREMSTAGPQGGQFIGLCGAPNPHVLICFWLHLGARFSSSPVQSSILSQAEPQTRKQPPPPQQIFVELLPGAWWGGGGGGRLETIPPSVPAAGLQSGGVVRIGEEGRTAAPKDKSRVLSAVPE